MYVFVDFVFVNEHDDAFDDEAYADELKNKRQRLDRPQQDDDADNERHEADDERPDPVFKAVVFQQERFLHLHDRIQNQNDAGQNGKDGDKRLGRENHEPANQGAGNAGKERHGADGLALHEIDVKLVHAIREQNPANDARRHRQDAFVKKTKNKTKNHIYNGE